MTDVFDKMVKSPTWQKILADKGWNDLYLKRKEYAHSCVPKRNA